MSHPVYKFVLGQLFDESPYKGVRPKIPQTTVDGWGAESSLFQTLIEELSPSVIIEVGTWKGASAINMARILRERSIECTVICIDTWLGSVGHRNSPESRSELKMVNGFPNIYIEFLSNVVSAGLTDVIIPIPQPSSNAFFWLKENQIEAPLIYIDGDHEALNVYSDVANYWQLVSDGGVLFGDDFLVNWMGVVKAVREFAEKNSLSVQTYDEKWILRKKLI